ncbi:8227_t:CDS:2, partial [Entrophospora sp. SA101]
VCLSLTFINYIFLEYIQPFMKNTQKPNYKYWQQDKNLKKYIILATITGTVGLTGMSVKGSNDLIIVITSATDGRIAIWEFSKKIYSKNNSKTTFTKTTKSNPTTKYSKDNDFQNIEDLGKPNYYYQAHQSGVDCFDFHQLSSSSSSLKNGQIIRYMIVSGGDDNSIMVKYVDFCLIKNEDNKLMIKEVNDEDDDFDKFKTLKFDKAHASSIQVFDSATLGAYIEKTVRGSVCVNDTDHGNLTTHTWTPPSNLPNVFGKFTSTELNSEVTPISTLVAAKIRDYILVQKHIVYTLTQD